MWACLREAEASLRRRQAGYPRAGSSPRTFAFLLNRKITGESFRSAGVPPASAQTSNRMRACLREAEASLRQRQAGCPRSGLPLQTFVLLLNRRITGDFFASCVSFVHSLFDFRPTFPLLNRKITGNL
jgi:hypothetical protein